MKKNLSQNNLLQSIQINQIDYINKVFLDKLTESLPQYIFWKDEHSVYLGCNKNFARLVGLDSPQDIIGKTDYDLNWQPTGHSVEAFREGDRQTLSGNPVNNQEETLVLPNGKKLITLVSKLPIIDNGKAIGIVGYFTDITTRRKAEEREKQALAAAVEERTKAAQSEEELREAIMIITGSIVHDLRTPIVTVNTVGANLNKFLSQLIEGYKRAVKAGLIDQPMKKSHLSVLDKSGNTLQELSSDMNNYIDRSLLTLRKALEKDLSQADLIKCSMADCIRETINYYPFLQEERTWLEVCYDDNFYFMGNEIMMVRVLTNLIKNVLYQIKKNKKGKIFISMDTREPYNTLHVKDTAGGAPDKSIPTLFDAYKTNKREGSGIGLAFCKKTIHDFGGEMKCESVFGSHIDFTMSFPKISSD